MSAKDFGRCLLVYRIFEQQRGLAFRCRDLGANNKDISTELTTASSGGGGEQNP
jgi:hypothetical protein